MIFYHYKPKKHISTYLFKFCIPHIFYHMQVLFLFLVLFFAFSIFMLPMRYIFSFMITMFPQVLQLKPKPLSFSFATSCVYNELVLFFTKWCSFIPAHLILFYFLLSPVPAFRLIWYCFIFYQVLFLHSGSFYMSLHYDHVLFNLGVSNVYLPD